MLRISYLMPVLLITILNTSPLQAKEYLPYATFTAWQALVPELSDLQLCGTSKAGMDLWAKGEMRIPLEENNAKVLNLHLVSEEPQGGGVWAAEVTSFAEPYSCYVLLTENSGDSWHRLLLQKIPPEGNLADFYLTWNKENAAFGLDFGERKRLTKPATMTWSSDGTRGGQAGYVIEKRLISQLFRWNKDRGQFEYMRLDKPELWDTE